MTSRIQADLVRYREIGSILSSLYYPQSRSADVLNKELRVTLIPIVDNKLSKQQPCAIIAKFCKHRIIESEFCVLHTIVRFTAGLFAWWALKRSSFWADVNIAKRDTENELIERLADSYSVFLRICESK